MKVFISLFLIFIMSFSGLKSAEIFGNSKEYANNKLIFYKYSDRITFLKEELFVLEIDNNGNFRQKIDIGETTYVFGEFGIYHAYFYLESNGIYELILPPFAEKEPKDIFNPYFEPEKIHIGIKNMKENDLNYLIMDFDYFYNRYFDINYLDVYFKGLESDVDTFINKINVHYGDVDNEYFNTYKKYRIAALKNIATQKKYESVTSLAYFAKAPILYDNPAYMDLFNSIYDSYFDKYLVSPQGFLLYAIINYGHSLARMHKLLSRNVEHRHSEQFRELVIMKGVYDAFGNRNVSWKPLLLTLDSLIISTKYDYHKQIAQNVADKVISMASNTVAPIYELENTDGKKINLMDYRGKYVYIQFANTASYSSKMEFDLLKKIYYKYKGVCVFHTILTDENKEKAKKYIEKNGYEWNFSFTEINSSVINMYKIDAYPSYFLVDPEGILKLSPAPSPSENFEKILFKIIEDEKGGKEKN